MRTFLKVVGGLVALLVILIVIALVVGGRATTANGLTMEYTGPAQRVDDYAGFNVRFTNSGSTDSQNPQIRAVIDLGGKQWSCQGYRDPMSDAVVTGTDPIARPLVIPAGQEIPVTILCRIPPAPLGDAKVRLR